MHILYLVPHLPNPTKVRSHYHIRGLVDAGHKVTVASIIRKPIDREHIAVLKSQGVDVIAESRSLPRIAMSALMGFVMGYPLQGRLMWSAGLMDAIKDAMRQFPPDVVHVEHLRMTCYGLRLRHQWPVVWDAVDHLGSFYGQTGRASTSIAWRAAGSIESSRLWSHERWLTSQFPVTLVIGRRDLSLFQEGNPCADRVEVASPGFEVVPMHTEPRSANVLIFTGTMDYHPNVTSLLYFVREILPIIWDHQPDVRLQVVGARPSSEVKALASSRIEVTGMVPSVEDYLSRAAVALAPIRYAGGLQFKVLEAFLTGTPVVATPVTAEGLDVTHERELLIADTPDAFAGQVLRLLQDAQLRQKIGSAGRAYVEQNHDLRRTTQRLIDFYGLAQRRFSQEKPSC